MKIIFAAVAALLMAPSASPAATIFETLGTLFVTGNIEPGDFDKVDQALTPKTYQAQIRSMGGNVIEARKIGDLIAARDLPLKVRDYCVSACASEIFVLAHRRIVMDGAFLAFHGGDGAVARQLARLELDYAQAHPDDEKLQHGTQQWQAQARAMDDAFSRGMPEDFSNARRRFEALTTPVVRSITFDKATSSVSFDYDHRAPCDFWVPPKEYLSQIGLEADWKGELPGAESIARTLKTTTARIYRGSILQIDPDAPAGCNAGAEAKK